MAANLLLGVAARRQIKLIGFVDKLHRALQPDRIEAAPGKHHFEAAQIALQVGRRRLQLFSPERTPDVPVADAVAASRDMEV